MSLSVLLVPAAIGIGTSIVSYALQSETVEGAFCQVDTSMKDESILKKALSNYGCSVQEKEQIESAVGEIEFVFQKQQNGTMSALFHQEMELEDAQEFIKGVQKEYKRIVQKQTYEKLMERAKEEGLILESENKNGEESLVLTFQVRE